MRNKIRLSASRVDTSNQKCKRHHSSVSLGTSHKIEATRLVSVQTTPVAATAFLQCKANHLKIFTTEPIRTM